MKRTWLPYIPFTILFVFALATIVVHFAGIPRTLGSRTAEYSIPFDFDEKVRYVASSAEADGLKRNDEIISINGIDIKSPEMGREFDLIRGGKTMNMTVVREVSPGQNETLQLVVEPPRIIRDLSFFLRNIVSVMFSYILPAFCMLLGFWVVFVRPRDHLAWLLLFVLLGFAAIGLEGGSKYSIVSLFRSIFSSSWALSMFLFGIYFPERLSLDKKAPWFKWIFIVVLGPQIFIVLLGQLKLYFGITIVDQLDPFLKYYFGLPTLIANILAIGLFFAFLGWKSGTLESRDARRRLRLMVIGTTVAMLPAFSIILYGIITGIRGSFFEVAPSWIAFLALLLIMLFPLTMAYVIVVQRAMDVSVVIRQGLQYALAKNGVFAVQIIFSIAVIFTALSFITDSETNRPQKITFIALGVTLVFVIRLVADKIRVWTDRRFFREAYDSEQILSDLSEEVRSMVELKPLFETLSTKISESLHVPQIAMLLKDGDHFQPAYSLGYSVPPSIVLRENAQTIKELKKDDHLIVYQDNVGESESETDQEAKELHGLNSQLLLAVGVKDELSGIISLSPKRSEEPYSPNDLRLLKSVASQTGLALQNSKLTEAIAYEAVQKERLNRELEIAREVQERLFPQELPKIEGLDYYGACRPALGVGGDYYDFLELADGKFGIAIGDVSGKGIGASLVMASLQASLRGQAIHSGNDLAGLMRHVNKLVYDASTTDRYATFFYAQYDPETKKLIYVNAGHNPPYVLRRNANGDLDAIPLTEGGPVVGMLPPIIVQYEQGELQMETGDILVGFTDGISESMNPAEEEWGEEAMLSAIERFADRDSKEILEKIVQNADEFANGAKQHDDMTMIVVKVIG